MDRVEQTAHRKRYNRRSSREHYGTPLQDAQHARQWREQHNQQHEGHTEMPDADVKGA